VTEDSVDELVHRIRLLASTHGYAIGVHGSLERDVDLIAVPWVRESASPDDLADAVARALGSRARLRSERCTGESPTSSTSRGAGCPATSTFRSSHLESPGADERVDPRD
jgi:hypothetical protein